MVGGGENSMVYQLDIGYRFMLMVSPDDSLGLVSEIALNAVESSVVLLLFLLSVCLVITLQDMTG